MTSRARITGSLAALVLGVALLTASAGAAAPAEQRQGPGYHEPEVGSCHALSYDQAAKTSDTHAAVSCSARHTLLTVKVKRLRTPVPWNDAAKLAKQFQVPCHRAATDALGGSDKIAALSAYDVFFFTPTKAERAQGAAWVRCDLALWAGPAKLDALPTSVALGSLPLPASVAYCLVGKKLFDTTCHRTHDWKSVGLVTLARHPSDTAARRIGNQRCPGITGTRRYAFHWPSIDEFRAGNHFLVCFKPN